MLKTLMVGLLPLIFVTNAYGGMDFGTQNTFHGQGAIDLNLKSRNYLRFGFESIKLGGVFHYNRPYSHHREMFYGASVGFGQKWRVDVDAGLIERTVFGTRGTGVGGALVFAYYITKGWHIAVPIFYKNINDGDLSERVEVNLLPYIGYNFEIF